MTTPSTPAAPSGEPGFEPTDAADLVVVGAGIVGLAHALEAAQRGLRVTVLERDRRAVGASIRNFGHVCATAQAGPALDYALFARERWLRLAEKAGFSVQETGTLVVARTPAEQAVLEEFAAERGGDQVRLLTAAGARGLFRLATEEVVGGAHLPLDVRLDPRIAVPALADWLAGQGVQFGWGVHVGGIEPGLVHTAYGPVRAERVVCASGHDVDRLFPRVADEHGVRRCRLHMLEVAPPGGVEIAPAVLTGTSMLRYGGLAAQPSAAAVRAELAAATPELLEVDMNLMLTQRPDGSIVLGDTHHYERTHLPFDEESVTDLVLREGARLLEGELTVRRRWRGIYAHSPLTDFLVAEPHPGTRVVSVTSGIGMTTALGLAPTVLDHLF
ncbi:TIGR03364 family FAD-dependent oxidoreductase [Actinopolymorpha alba]|uniref:TIGR03364 family FAD-dependent oxidoreductase n=1 Tax=Actinopolymorpha alba TaxID=533267 RepID=UPI0003790C49|nr:TIGR03364 family FAD-dependent oxidoreductase [Actinopolymorpha alba]